MPEDFIKAMQDAAKAIGLPYEDVDPQILKINLDNYFQKMTLKNEVAAAIKFKE
jgi:hypothetical protein